MSMFKTRFVTENGIDLVILEDTSSQTSVAIAPHNGAMLHRFEVYHRGELMNVVDHYPDEHSLRTQLESGGFKSAKLSPFVCRLYEGKYNFAGADYQVEKFYLLRHALHGIIYDAAFEVASHRGGEESAIVELIYDYMGTDKGYPFIYRCMVRYELKINNSLSVNTFITNSGEGLIPIADGWHPYFTFGGLIDDLQMEFQAIRKVEFDDELIPTGKLTPYDEFNSLKEIGDVFIDNCYELDFSTCQPMVVLRDPAKMIQLEIRPDKSYPYLQLYTPPTRRSIALENISSAPDAFNNQMGLAILQPGEQKEFITNFKIKSII